MDTRGLGRAESFYGESLSRREDMNKNEDLDMSVESDEIVIMDQRDCAPLNNSSANDDIATALQLQRQANEINILKRELLEMKAAM